MLSDLTVNHVELYVGDLAAAQTVFVQRYGFRPVATSDRPDADHRSVALRQGAVVLVLTQPRAESHPAHAYLAAHGDGVADIALRTGDVRSVFDRATAGGARPLAAPAATPAGVTAVIDGLKH